MLILRCVTTHGPKRVQPPTRPLAETARAVVCAADREERLLQRGRRSTDSSDRLCVPSMLNVDEVNAKSMLSPKAGPARGAVWRPPPSPVHVASPSERSTPFRTKVPAWDACVRR